MLNISSFLSKYFKKDDKIILACSWWPDSMFLLYKILETDYRDNLVVCYFNHKTRKETDIEEDFLRELSKKENILFETDSFDFYKIKSKNDSLEEIARHKRYDFLNNVLSKHNWIYVLTAHHLDDKIETFLFNLARWTKLTWLVNMQERSWNILRPLLNLEKKDISEYLDKNNLKYFIDETNFDTKITRNFTRHEIIPDFYKLNKNFKSNISNLLNYFSDLKNYIDDEVKFFLNINNKFVDNSEKRFFSLKWFKMLDSFMQKEVIRYIYFISNSGSTLWLSESNINEIIRFLNWKNNKTLKEIKNLNMFKDGDRIYY